MIYNHVPSREVIRRVTDHYNIKSSDWRVRAFEWIGEALREMNIFDGFQLCHEDMNIVDYKGELPCNIEGLKHIDYNGTLLARVNSANLHDRKKLANSIPAMTYQLDRTGGITAGIKTGTVRVHFYQMPVAFCEELNMKIPLVPDKEKILKAVEFYILFRILARGYKHPIYSLNANLTSNNPSKLWDKWLLKARNSGISFDREAREIHRRIWSSVILDPDEITTDFH